MTTACGLPWLILMGGPSFLGSGYLSLMLAYYWTWLLLKSPNLLGLPPPEWVENINHISLDNFSKPVWGNDAFRDFLFGGRRCSFLSLFFFMLLGNLVWSYFLTQDALMMMIEQICFFFLYKQLRKVIRGSSSSSTSDVLPLAAVLCRFPVAESSELLEEVQALKDIPSPHFEPDSIFQLTKVPMSEQSEAYSMKAVESCY